MLVQATGPFATEQKTLDVAADLITRIGSVYGIANCLIRRRGITLRVDGFEIEVDQVLSGASKVRRVSIAEDGIMTSLDEVSVPEHRLHDVLAKATVVPYKPLNAWIRGDEKNDRDADHAHPHAA